MKRKIALIIATTGATLAAVSFPLEPYATTYQAIMQTEVQQQEEQQKKADEYNQYLLAQIITAETGGEAEDEMAKVGQVVLNRVNSKYWEFKDYNTIYQVLTQKGQYPETYQKIVEGLKPSEKAMEIAKKLLKGEIKSGLSKDVLWQTGFIPKFNVKVILKTKYHYYSVLED